MASSYQRTKTIIMWSAVAVVLVVFGLMAAPALHAQFSGSGQMGISQADLAAAAADNLIKMQSFIPPACSAAPAADTLNGTAGSDNSCFQKRDSTRPTAVQRANVYTDAVGNWTVTWSRAGSALGVVDANAIQPVGGPPIICGVTSQTTTVTTGVCWKANAGQQYTISLGINVDTRQFNTAPPTSTRVMVKIAEPTQ